MARAKGNRQIAGGALTSSRILEALEPRRLLSATLVADLSPGDAGSFPANFAATGNLGFFATYKKVNSTYISSLYTTDGTPAGTSLVQAFGSSISSLKASGGLAYFVVQSSIPQVWRSDGTPGGTFPVTNFTKSSFPSQLTAVNGSLFFFADSGSSIALWKSSGTPETTAPIGDPTRFNYLDKLTAAGNTIYFIASLQGTSDDELWRTDGTDTGTFRVKDIYPGPIGSGAGYLSNVDGELFFVGHDNTGNGLFKSDGTEAGTVLVKSQSAMGIVAWVSAPVGAGNTAYFPASDGNAIKLYKSDGTPEGTGAIPLNVPANFDPTGLTSFGGKLYFSATTAAGAEPWVSDGTTEGTTMLADIAPGSASSNPREFTVLNGALYFIATDPVHGPQLWRTDGTSGGTQIIDTTGGTRNESTNVPVYLTPFPDAAGGPKLLFSNTDTTHGNEPWVSDGTSAGTTILVNLETTLVGSALATLVAAGNRVFVSGPGGSWVSDGRSAHTVFLGPTPIDTTGSSNAVVLNGVLIYASNGQLWRSDGTRQGTYIVSGAVKSPSWFSVSGNVVYFSGIDAVEGGELWVTDGTAAGTHRVSQFSGGANTTGPGNVFAANGSVFFTAAARALGKSDGTASGTIILNGNLPSGESMGQFKQIQSWVYFTTTAAVWRSDGTVAGTVNLTNGQNLTVAKSSPVCQLGSSVYFLAGSPSGSSGVPGLWKIDLASTGPATLVKTIGTKVDSNSQAGFGMTVMNGRLYFTGPNQTTIWASDGTAAGTTIVSNNFAASLTPVGNSLYFVSSGKLWVTDGTQAGTAAVPSDPAPDVTSVNHLTPVDGALVFSAFHPLYENELWMVDTPVPIPSAPTGFSAAPVSNAQIHLSWTDTSSVESGFQIQRSTDPSFANVGVTFDLPPNRTSFDDRPLAKNTQYYYRLVAFSRSGDSAALTANATTLSAVPAAPSDLAASAVNDRSVTLTWVDNASDEAGYTIQRATDPGFNSVEATYSLSANSTTFADTSTVPLDRYYYRVYATSPAGNSDYSLAQFNTPDRAPSAVEAAGVSPNRIDLQWSNLSSTTTLFQIQRASSSAGPFTQIGVVAGTKTTYPDLDLAPQSTWFYRIIAVSASGNSQSDVVSATTTLGGLTTPVGALNPSSDQMPDSMVAFNGGIYFAFTPESDNGRGPIYRTDGTDAGTTLVFDGQAFGLFVAGNQMYFSAFTAEAGVELWVTDGTMPGTHMVADLTPGTGASNPIPLGYLGGDTLLFGIPSGDNRTLDLWRTDGTAANTIRVADHLVYLQDASLNMTPVVLNNVLYFTGFTNRYNLWRSDGTVTGTYQVAPALADTSVDVSSYAALGNSVYFFAWDATHKYALWKTDGSADGTVMLIDLPDDNHSPSFSGLTAIGGALYFMSSSGTWKSDGTAQGTAILNSNATNPSNFTGVGDLVYFFSAGYLWKTDGTQIGTTRVTAVNIAGPYTDAYLINVNGVLFYSDGIALWTSDGTFAGTHQVSDIVDFDAPQIYPLKYTGKLAASVGGLLIFGAMTPEGGRELRAAYATAPNAPASLSIAAAPAGVQLTWADNSTTESQFILERSTRADFGSLSATIALPPNTTSYTDTSTSIGDAVYYRIRAVNAGGQSAASNAVTSGIPSVLSAGFDVNKPQKLMLAFSADVSGSLVSSALHLTNLASGAEVPSSQLILSYDHSSNTAQIGFAGGTVPDGRYRLTLRGVDILSSLGVELDGDGDGAAGGDFVFDFFQLAGDADRDAMVGFSDLVAVAQHYGQSAQSLVTGDLNGDGFVDFADLVIVAQGYGKSLPVLPGAAASLVPLALRSVPSGPAISAMAFPKQPAAVNGQPGARTWHPAPVSKPASRSDFSILGIVRVAGLKPSAFNLHKRIADNVWNR